MKKRKIDSKKFLMIGVITSALSVAVTGVATTFAIYDSSVTVKNSTEILQISSNGRRDTTLVFYVDINSYDWCNAANSNIEVHFWNDADNSKACHAKQYVYRSGNYYTIGFTIDYFRPTVYDRVNVTRTNPWNGYDVWNTSATVTMPSPNTANHTIFHLKVEGSGNNYPLYAWWTTS